MVRVFNPPPNWPTPPVGWVPPPGWQPEAAWGQPPQGWELWVRANAHPFRPSFLVGAVVYTLLLAVAGMLGDLNAELAGRLFFWGLAPALAVGFIARASGTRWRWWLYVLSVVAGVVVLAVVSASGRG